MWISQLYGEKKLRLVTVDFRRQYQATFLKARWTRIRQNPFLDIGKVKLEKIESQVPPTGYRALTDGSALSRLLFLLDSQNEERAAHL